MLTDAVFTHLEIPEEYIRDMGEYVPLSDEPIFGGGMLYKLSK